MIVRQAGPEDRRTWAAMLARLHAGQSAAEFESELEMLTRLDQPYVGFLAIDGDRPIGMIDIRERNYAEGAPKLRAAYVEDLWVDPDWRRRGVARLLLDAAEQWARRQGFEWLGSDTTADNELSQSWHRSAGFEEIERLVVFGKPLH